MAAKRRQSLGSGLEGIDMSGPLAGIRIVEFESIGPGPYGAMLYGAMLLSDLGADILRIARPGVDRGALIEDRGHAVMHRGRRAITLDLKAPGDLDLARRLIARADGLIEGLRPGVMEKLGLGPAEALALNPRLVYGRITGWGQQGPLARSVGHDINYIALSGALAAIGPVEGPPLPPLNLVGDFGGGGLYLAFGMLAALIEAGRTGRGQVIGDALCLACQRRVERPARRQPAGRRRAVLSLLHLRRRAVCRRRRHRAAVLRRADGGFGAGGRRLGPERSRHLARHGSANRRGLRHRYP
jgi:crotonobetainyl-CoA:carnitine CoA-transferase CaiB-like acyl-CoA transferase